MAGAWRHPAQAELVQPLADGAHAVVLCDGDGWHQTGGALTLQSNLSLLPIPPYSPELNPMEIAWDYLRGNQFSHQIWDTYDDIVQPCTKAWRFLVNEQNRIRSIAHREWAGGRVIKLRSGRSIGQFQQRSGHPQAWRIGCAASPRGWLVRFAARERERRQRAKEEMHEGTRRRSRENPQ